MLDFSRADEASYAEVMKRFGKFVWSAYEYENASSDTSQQRPSRTVPGDPELPPPLPVSTPAAPSLPPPPDAAAPSPTTGTVPGISNNVNNDAYLNPNLTLPASPPPFDEFDFSDEMLAMTSTPAVLLPGLGLATAVNPYDTRFAVPLSTDLLLRLEEMPEAARAARVEQLAGLDAAALERENNAARNFHLLNNMGLGDAQKETLWSGTTAPPPKAKRKAGKEGRRGRGKKSRMLKEVEASEDSDTGSESEGDKAEDSAAGKTSGGAKEAGVTAAPAKTRATAAKGSSSSKWAETARTFMLNKPYGDAWQSLVGVWWAREERAGFVGTRQGHPARKRPKAIGDWVSRARNHTPVVEDAEEFGKEFWVWWIDINPSWREKKRPMLRNDGKNWLCLDYKGQNGFLNVLMLLKWWRDAMEEGSPDWEEAVNDVTWVLQQMNECSEDNPILPDATTNPATATKRPTVAEDANKSPTTNEAAADAGGTGGGPAPHDNTPRSAPQLPHPPPRPKPRPLNRGMLDRDVPSEAEPMREAAGLLLGTEGLSQEELDEINADMEADMDEDEE
ncbi:hypothetical protein MSAN_02000900 [Mycena sanguinolenta]|uniref:Uncharacterized protein n=1 Tax=Mycena sanguinolenta TaxID=230812 RepID=A0A8H6XKF0_9AGAR|nr:hypothetical protein MSAN_02000900 [Mycena sanguinolenta]